LNDLEGLSPLALNQLGALRDSARKGNVTQTILEAAITELAQRAMEERRAELMQRLSMSESIAEQQSIQRQLRDIQAPASDRLGASETRKISALAKTQS
jgi:hypothetical protein